jgi:hypothetical protein
VSQQVLVNPICQASQGQQSLQLLIHLQHSNRLTPASPQQVSQQQLKDLAHQTRQCLQRTSPQTQQCLLLSPCHRKALLQQRKPRPLLKQCRPQQQQQ